MFKEIDILILAGGKGQRMGHLTKEKQKCLLEVSGKPILSHVFDNIITAFGSARVIVALGYQGESVRDHYGPNYKKLSIEYVHDSKDLETKKRLLLAKELLISLNFFLFLAGDILCHPEQLVRIVEAHQQELTYSMGTISGASYHKPALSHALLASSNEKLISVNFPPNESWSKNQFREMHVACYHSTFLSLLEAAPQNTLHLSKVIMEAVKNGCYFHLNTYKKNWYHFVSSSDLNTKIDSAYDKKQFKTTYDKEI